MTTPVRVSVISPGVYSCSYPAKDNSLRSGNYIRSTGMVLNNHKYSDSCRRAIKVDGQGSKTWVPSVINHLPETGVVQVPALMRPTNPSCRSSHPLQGTGTTFTCLHQWHSCPPTCNHLLLWSVINNYMTTMPICGLPLGSSTMACNSTYHRTTTCHSNLPHNIGTFPELLTYIVHFSKYITAHSFRVSVVPCMTELQSWSSV